jgi:hypothetical protein
VGNSASGIDLSTQIGAVCKKPIFVSEKAEPTGPVEVKNGMKMVPEIVEVYPETRGVKFSNGIIENEIDAIVFCTGYFYSYPFFKGSEPNVTTGDGSHVRNLYEHALCIDDPTVVFLGVPQRIVPFPFSEAQIAWVARIWANRLALPTKTEMKEWLKRELEAAGPSKWLHNMKTPKDVAYINRLHDISMTAKRVDGLDNDGVGKIPPYWDEETAWVREQIPLIKVASRKIGERRHEVKTLEELGFDYKTRQHPNVDKKETIEIQS